MSDKPYAPWREELAFGGAAIGRRFTAQHVDGGRRGVTICSFDRVCVEGEVSFLLAKFAAALRVSGVTFLDDPDA